MPEQSLWGPSVSGFLLSTDTPSQELMVGTRFNVTCAGRLVGFRLLAHPSYDGLSVGFLWFDNGQLELCESLPIILSAAGGTTPVWHQLWLHPRHRLLPDTNYVVGVFLNRDLFVYRPASFDTPMTNGCITAPSNSPSVPNGLFAYSPHLLMPTGYGGGTAYGVDILFQPD